MTITFNTREEALDYIYELDNQVYYLNHGEYQRPRLKARKVRGENLYYIHVTYHYYLGTFNTKQDGAL